MALVLASLDDITRRIMTLESRDNGEAFEVEDQVFLSGAAFMEFAKSANPTGAGMSAFASLHTIDNFVQMDQTEVTEWAQQAHRATGMGMASQIELATAATSNNPYPAYLFGNVKRVNTLETISIFASVQKWRGQGQGTGARDILNAALRVAFAQHEEYAKDNLTGKLLAIALWTNRETKHDLMVLFNHFDNEIVLLLGFNIKESQVMQFLSDQLMRIVREVHKEMRAACVVDLSQSNRAVMCARIALCSIRACLKMNEFVKADISRHPVYNTLTCSS